MNARADVLGIVTALQERRARFADRHPALRRHFAGKGPDTTDAKTTYITVDCRTGERSLSMLVDREAMQNKINTRAAAVAKLELERLALKREEERLALALAMNKQIESARVPVSGIFAAVSAATGYTYGELAGPRRGKPLVRARQTLYWLIKRLRPDLSYPAIGRAVGNRDHTTPMAGVLVFERKRDQSPIREWLMTPELSALLAKVVP